MPVVCPKCQVTNRDTARFCSNCAAPLTGSLTCPGCGAAHPSDARFCLQCGVPLRGASPPGGLGTGLLQANALLQDRYMIVRLVGQGGMGAVYEAADQRIPGKRWALKEMSGAALGGHQQVAEAAAAFRQEAQVLAKLSHPNLPTISDFFSEGSKQYLVMEFVDGETLEAKLVHAQAPLAEPPVVEWAQQVCDVLVYLHSRRPPVIFRDLKPSNIMIDDTGRVKLIDFGIARIFKPGKSGDTQVMGTPGYAAPEQYGKAQTDPRSDVYSLGVSLLRLLTGYDPAESPFNLPSVRSMNPKVSPAMEAIIDRATQHEAGSRYQSAREMLADLQALGAGGAVSTPAGGLKSILSQVSVQQHQKAGAAAAASAHTVSAASLYGGQAARPVGFRSRLWVTLGIALLVGALAGTLASLAMWALGFVGVSVASAGGSLAAKLTRRPGAAFLSVVAAWLTGILLLSSGYLAPPLYTLAMGAAIEFSFLMGSYRRFGPGATVLATISGMLGWFVLFFAANEPVAALERLPACAIGAAITGAAAWLIGKAFRR